MKIFTVQLQVLQEGKIVEFDEPYILLQDESSLLFKMIEQTGKEESEHLLTIAQEAYFIRNQPNPAAIIPDSERTELTSNITSQCNGEVETQTIV